MRMPGLKRLHIAFVAVLALGVGIGVLADRVHKSSVAAATNAPHPVREKNAQYAFINPLLFYNAPSDPGGHQSFLTQVGDDIDAAKKTDSAIAASIYFKDLMSGSWVGVNTSEKYNPASLLKVAVMIAYFKEAQINPDTLSRHFVYSVEVQKTFASVPYAQPTSLVPNGDYAANDLIEKMIVHSDNGATYTLLAHISSAKVDQVFTDLGISNPEDATYKISVGQYAYFFRVLYNATYLDRTLSERALSLLSQSDFADGLSGGVPDSVTIAHKYGEHVGTHPDGTPDLVELHDCGIIYYPSDNPYLLCVMTRGHDIEKLKQLIQQISKVAYTTVPKP